MNVNKVFGHQHADDKMAKLKYMYNKYIMQYYFHASRQ